MTFADILLDAYRRLRLPAAPPAATIVRIKALVNEVHRELLTAPGISRLRDGNSPIPVTITANVARSGLPPVVSRIRGITDRTNNKTLTELPLADLRQMDPGQLFLGGPAVAYADVGYQPVQFQPTAATGLWASSSSATDTGAPAVFIQTFRTGGYQYDDTEPLTGVTRVAIGTGTPLTDHEQVTRFYLSAVCVGSVSLWTASVAGVELARIEPGRTSQHYLTVEWFPIATADATVYVDYTRNIPDLVQPFDEPLLPVDFHDVIGLGVRAKEYELLDDNRESDAKGMYERRVAALKSYVLNNGEAIASLRPRSGGRWSRLGSTYPAERYS